MTDGLWVLNEGLNQIWSSLLISFITVLSCIYYAQPLQRKLIKRWQALLFIILSFLFCVYWNMVNGLTPAMYLIGFYILFFLILMFIYGQSWQNAIFYGLMYYFSTGYIARVMSWFYKLFGGGYYTVEIYFHWANPLIYIINALVMFAVLFLVRKQLRSIIDYDLNQIKLTEYLCVLILAMPVAYFCYFLTLLSVTYTDLPFGFVLIRAIISIGAEFAMFGYASSRKQEKELVELRIIKNRLSDQYERHLIKAKSSDLVMQKYHDLQKFLRILQDTCQEGSIQKYQTELSETINTFESIYETGNPTLDSILSEKSRACKEQQITLVCVADGSLIGFMDPIDICAIFGNALDNAIESARQLSDPDKKVIQVKLHQKDYFLFLSFENFYEHELVWNLDSLLTSKPDLDAHGYGIKSIQYSVGKYGGDLKISAEQGKFKLMVLFSR